ncbi:MAG: molybdopterin-dependent oxidoreductase [Candidatus Bathyarchaeota archaeon]
MKNHVLTINNCFIVILFSLSTMVFSPQVAANSENVSEYRLSDYLPEWNLIVTGYVENPLNLSWSQIVSLPKTIVNSELICVDWPDQVVFSGNWTGVRLNLLLQRAELSPQAMKVAFFATDNFSTDLALETAMRDDIIIAYELNGEPLYDDVRLVVPGKWGYKWIHHIELVILYNTDFLGHYESNGFSDEANINSPSPPSRMIPEFQQWMILPIFLIATTALMIIRRYRITDIKSIARAWGVLSRGK